MPMYDFQCTKCEHVFEEMAPMAGPLPVCPECQGAVEKVITPVNFNVKKKSAKRQYEHKKAVEDFKATRKKQQFAVSTPKKKS